jgi:hypothetical protein
VPKIIDFEVWALVLLASFVIAKLVNAIKAQAVTWWTRRTDTQRERWGWVIIVVSAGLMWLTGLNGLPGFSAVWAPAGRILTCFLAGFGPGVVYDVWMDRPEPLTPPSEGS